MYNEYSHPKYQWNSQDLNVLTGPDRLTTVQQSSATEQSVCSNCTSVTIWFLCAARLAVHRSWLSATLIQPIIPRSRFRLPVGPAIGLGSSKASGPSGNGFADRGKAKRPRRVTPFRRSAILAIEAVHRYPLRRADTHQRQRSCRAAELTLKETILDELGN